MRSAIIEDGIERSGFCRFAWHDPGTGEHDWNVEQLVIEMDAVLEETVLLEFLAVVTEDDDHRRVGDAEGVQAVEQRAERRYDTYSSGTRQFEGYFKITSMGGSRISLKQTFKTTGPFFLLAVEKGGRLYAVHGGNTA